MINLILTVTWRDVVAQLRSRSFMVFTLLLPIVLTLIIGNAIGGTTDFKPLPVAVVGTGEIANGLKKLLADTKTAVVFTLADASQAETMVRIGKATMSIVLPERLEIKFLRNDPLNIEVYLDPTSHQRGELIKQLVQGYMQQLEAARAALLGSVQAIAPATAADLQNTLLAVRTKIEKQYQIAAVNLEQKEAGGRSQGIFAYYAVAFGVMFTLLSATNGAGGVIDELERGTIHRLLASPLTPTLLLVSKFIALWILGVWQLGVFAVFSSIIYGVSWGSPLAVLPVLLATAAAAAGFGGIILGISRSREQLNTLSLVFVLVMSLLGGSMWPLETLPAAAQMLSKLTYNRWSIEAFQLAAVSSSDPQILIAIAVLSAMAIVGVCFGSMQLARRMAR